MSQQIRLVMLALCCVLLQACVAVQTFPTAARAGDTITLALGSVDGLDKSKLTVYFTPSSTNVPINLTSNVRSVFKIYPDKASRAWLDTSDSASILNVWSGHGAWLSVAVVNLPASLPSGAGYFQVAFGNGVVVPNSSSVQSAEGIQIGAEILPVSAGAGSQSKFDYYGFPGNVEKGSLSTLESISRVVLRPGQANFYVSQIQPAAAEYVIKLPILGDIQALNNSSVHVIWDDKPGEYNKQIQLNWHRQADVITVNLLVPTDQVLQENLHRFSIIVLNDIGDNAIDPNGIPQLISYRYFDLNGDSVVPSYVPEVAIIK